MCVCKLADTFNCEAQFSINHHSLCEVFHFRMKFVQKQQKNVTLHSFHGDNKMMCNQIVVLNQLEVEVAYHVHSLKYGFNDPFHLNVIILMLTQFNDSKHRHS